MEKDCSYKTKNYVKRNVQLSHKNYAVFLLCTHTIIPVSGACSTKAVNPFLPQYSTLALILVFFF